MAVTDEPVMIGIRPGLGPRLIAWLISLTELFAGAVVAVEIGVLSIGVIARYVFQAPIVWTDELAQILFVWLSMLGSAIALHRGQHMRMTALVDRFGPSARANCETVALLACVAFMVLMLWPAIDYAHEESFVITPALELPGSMRAAALPVGLVLMVVFALAKAGSIARARLVTAFCLAAGITALVWLSRGFFLGLGNLNLVLFFVGLVGVAVFLGVPIAFAFGTAALGYIGLATNSPVLTIAGRMDEGMSHLILLAVPLFVFLGYLMELTGMAKAMVDFLAALLGHVRGGLSYVLIGAMYLVSGISGSKTADMAAVAPSLLPEMRKRGQKSGELVALLAATGAQTETIPPSLVLITIGSVTSVSIAALFTGGLVPAVVLGLFLTMVVWWRNRREDLSHISRPPRRDVLRAFLFALPALALPFIIRAAVVEGVATATEVSTIGIAYSVLVGILIYRRCDWSKFPKMLIDTAALSGAILFIIGAATTVAWCLTQSGFSRDLAKVMASLPGGGPTFMAVSILMFIVLGSVLEGIPALVLFAPLMFPIAKAVGLHEVHYAMVIILAMGMGLFLPPFGVGYYAACAIGRADPAQGIRPLMGYMLALLAGLIVVACIPWLSIGFL
ncbi:TRAP transporter, DctM subunit [Bradyrhizobium sp. Gha]|nr:TRAP transporter, DctM subunit [Bradyrhizobium sp. Gha]